MIRGAWLALCLAAVGCTDAATQVIVLVDAESAVRADTDHLRIRVQGRDGIDGESKVDKLDETLTGEIKWPVKLALEPAGGNAGRVFWIEATAKDGTKVLATARLLSGYVEGETRYAKLLIEDDCLMVSCMAQDDTCHDGNCVDAFRPPTALGKSAGDATDIMVSGDAAVEDGSVDADMDMDAATSDMDAGADASMQDAGMDAGPPPECTDSDECADTKPICDDTTLECRKCADDDECADKSSAAPVCVSGSCVECELDADCSDTDKPLCGSDGNCRGCVGNTECGTGACESSGACTPTEEVVYLAPSGGSSASDCGTQATPCAYFSDAVLLLDATRNVLVITPGTYTDLQLVFTGGVAVRVIGEDVTLNLLGSPSGPGARIQSAANVTLEGITIRAASDLSGSDPGIGVQCTDSTVTLERVSLLSNTQQGFSETTCTFTVRDSVIDGNGDYGVRLSGGQGVIERSTISNNLGGGLSVYDPSPLRIVNNLITGNSNTSNYAGALRSSSNLGTDTVIAFNTFTGNFVNQNYIGIIACPSDFIVDSNIVWGNTVDSGDLSQTFMGCTVTNSLTEAAATVGSSSTFSNMITSDPKFVDPGNGNYKLQTDSPAIDQGTADHAGELDRNGKPRTVGAKPDLGCYER